MVMKTTPVINVLNGGFVRLVDHMGSDLSIARAARVSYNADWRVPLPEDLERLEELENVKAMNDGALEYQGQDMESINKAIEELKKKVASDSKLISYLMTNRHTSPFESVTFTFEVKAPIFIFRQWHRHRTWSYNEISARYTELDEGFYVPDPSKIGIQSKDNKQVRNITDNVTDEQQASSLIIEQFCSESFKIYKRLLDKGVPRELARSVLPVAAYSRMFATVDLHNLLHFLRLRLHSHSQYEIRVYAEAIQQLITPIVPVTMAEFSKTL